MGGVGSASGKLILFGEHAAVYGHPAVGIPLPERTVVTLSGGGRDAWDLGPVAPQDRETAARILERLEDLHPDLSAFCTAWGRAAVGIASGVPRGAGFGSSAALSAAFAWACMAHAAPGSGIGEAGIWHLAHETERLFHGTPSGIDTGLSILPGLRSFTPRPPGLPDHEPLGAAPLHLVVGAVPRAGNCGALVAALGEKMRSGDPVAREAVESLGAIAGEARDILRAPDAAGAAALGRLAAAAHGRLRDLGLSTPALELLLEEGRRAGALGGKLSGAGGGGAFFLLVPDPMTARLVCSRLAATAAGQGIPLAAPLRCLPA
jgi:mevalonate kinase